MRLRSTLCLLAHGVVAANHAASDALARVDAALAWLAGNASALAHWAIKSRDDFKTKNWKHMEGGNVKNVYEAKFEGTRVVVKTRLGTAARRRGARRRRDARGRDGARLLRRRREGARAHRPRRGNGAPARAALCGAARGLPLLGRPAPPTRRLQAVL
jgi:hypothetical protein